MKYAILSIVLGMCLGASSCAAHHNHGQPVKSVTVLEAEHGNRDIVVVNARPGRDRRCWKHRRHWHCSMR